MIVPSAKKPCGSKLSITTQRCSRACRGSETRVDAGEAGSGVNVGRGVSVGGAVDRDEVVCVGFEAGEGDDIATIFDSIFLLEY